MRAYVYGQSALALLRYLRSIEDESIGNPGARIRMLTQPVHCSSQLKQLSFHTERLLAHAGENLELLVPEKSMISTQSNIKCHLWSRALPLGAFIKINDELYLSSPSFIFVQLAQELSVYQLALLGMELCGGYAITGTYTRDMKLRAQEDRGVHFNLRPICTAKRIAKFVDAAQGAWGAKQARRVSAWLTDRAASPMESASYLLLTLPKHQGGYGLPRPILNPAVRVSTEKGTEIRYPDLFWRAQAIDVEYDSDYAHLGEWSRYRDSKRQVELTVNRITVLPLTRSQLMNVDDFHDFAMGLQGLLGVRKRPFAPDWEYKRAQLRKELLLPQG